MEVNSGSPLIASSLCIVLQVDARSWVLCAPEHAAECWKLRSRWAVEPMWRQRSVLCAQP